MVGRQASADILGLNWSDPTRPPDPQWVGPLTYSAATRGLNPPTVGHGPAYLRAGGPVHLRQLPYSRGDFRTTSTSAGRSLARTGPGNHLGSGRVSSRNYFGHPFLVAEVALVPPQDIALILLSGRGK